MNERQTPAIPVGGGRIVSYEWPKTLCVNEEHIVGSGGACYACSQPLVAVIPADLARELYAVVLSYYDADHYQEHVLAHTRANEVMTRYEQMVGGSAPPNPETDPKLEGQRTHEKEKRPVRHQPRKPTTKGEEHE